VSFQSSWKYQPWLIHCWPTKRSFSVPPENASPSRKEANELPPPVEMLSLPGMLTHDLAERPAVAQPEPFQDSYP
jgi:hypothetical protein